MPDVRLVDANALIGCKNGVRRVVELTDGGMFGMVYPAVSLMDIKDAPTIEAAPVVHGRWVETGKVFVHSMYDLFTKCSLCSFGNVRNEYQEPYRYCPNCGAKMDGGAE